jgi:hypothetical protein
LFRDIARIGCHSWLDVEERERVEAKEEVGIAGVQWVRNAVVFLID